MAKITVKDTGVTIISVYEDYISLTDPDLAEPTRKAAASAVSV
ncbi:MAG: hypothetical protein ACLSGF_04345 [Alistipes onderdonkii]